MSFALDMSKFIGKTNAKVETTIRKIVLNVAAEVVRKSPVDSGRFKGNWDYGWNAAPSSDYDANDKTPYDTIDRNTAPSYLRIVGDMGAIKNVAGVHYLANNLEYAMALENGHSHTQAPQGIVGLTVLKFQSIVDNAAKGLV